MSDSLLNRQVLPFVALFAGLLVGAVAVDAILHRLDLVWVGRYLGIVGTVLILLSFFYSMRKRRLISIGRPQTLLTLHESLTWLGAMMILVHAGVHVYAILPWLALAAMMVTLISGMTGKYLLARSQRFLADKQADYERRGFTGEALEKALFWDAATLDVIRQWRAVHLPITLAFGVLSLIHIVSILLFWEWQ
jgi:hypothetical protein